MSHFDVGRGRQLRRAVEHDDRNVLQGQQMNAGKHHEGD